MKLMLASQFAKEFFCEGSRPSQTTLRKWVRDGYLPGKQWGKNFYIDVAKLKAGDDPYLEKILSDG